VLKIDQIDEVVATDEWRYRSTSGESLLSRIQIGRPQKAPNDPNGDWYCPVFVEHFTPRIVPVYGVGPVDSLMNAMALVRTFATRMNEFTPRASDHPNETKG
jgi:hypothetical protein